jgi:hypothetical protein
MRTIMLSLLVCCTSCGPEQIDQAVEGELGECVDRVDGTTQTCEAICAEQGSVCAEAACDGATYVIGILPEVCTDPAGGFPRDAECGAPIEWSFNNRVLCCCEVQP